MRDPLRIFLPWDWFGHLWAVCADLANWPVVGYRVPMEANITPPMLRGLLAPHGIRPIGVRLGWSTVQFSVRRRDAWMTQAVLDDARVPYLGGRTFKRPPFLPGAGGHSHAQPIAHAGGDWTAAATAQLQTRRAARRGGAG